MTFTHSQHSAFGGAAKKDMTDFDTTKATCGWLSLGAYARIAARQLVDFSEDRLCFADPGIMAERADVSRTALLQGIKQLEQSGHIYARQTYVGPAYELSEFLFELRKTDLANSRSFWRPVELSRDQVSDPYGIHRRRTRLQWARDLVRFRKDLCKATKPKWPRGAGPMPNNHECLAPHDLMQLYGFGDFVPDPDADASGGPSHA